MANATAPWWRFWDRRTKVPASVVHAPEPPPAPTVPAVRFSMKIAPEVLAASRRPRSGIRPQEAFAIPRPPDGVLPKRANRALLAMDDQSVQISAWAASWATGGWFEGPPFMGYPALSLLAALPEYRRMAEVLATECTRKWIRLGAADSQDKQKLEKITKLNTELERLDVRGAMRRLIELDAFFGRAHLFIDVGTDPDDRDELMKSIGNGRNGVTMAKFDGERGFLRGVKPIEPVWCYPSRYNATNPLKDDWYNPQTWYCQGQEVHVTRLMRFVGRELPDLLKPAYMFGGVSLSQLMKPYVDRWVTTVDSVARIITAFSTSGIKTNLETALKPAAGDMDLFARGEFFTNLRDNFGLMFLDKDAEDFFQFNVPLSELEALMSKMQETLCSVSGEPVVKLLGIQPAGLNASSEGELTSWLDWCEAYREKFCAPHLTTIIDFAQLSLFGEIDPDISWSFENLRSLDPKEETERRKVQAETDAAYVELGVFNPQEIRQGLLADPESPYFGLEEVVVEESQGPEGGGLVDPSIAAEFPDLEAPPGVKPEGDPVGRLGGIKIDETGHEDPRTARLARRPAPEERRAETEPRRAPDEERRPPRERGRAREEV